MNTFESELQNLGPVEGGYVDDPDDAGGETFRGISRRFHPTWPGWQYIDQLKRAGLGKKEIDAADDLNPLVADFYRANFWDRFQGDTLPPTLAAELFDTAVNTGVYRAVLWFQQALNLLNRNGKDYADIVEDGVFGPGTYAAMLSYLQHDRPETLLKIMNVLQGAHYIEYMQKSPTQEKFARGWFTRVTLGG